MRLEPFRAAGLFILGRGELWLQLLGVAGDREKGGREEEGGEESGKGLHGVGPEVSLQRQGPACRASLSGA